MDIPYTVEIRPDTGLTNGKIGIWLFLASEVMLFGALFASYILIRTGNPSWPQPPNHPKYLVTFTDVSDPAHPKKLFETLMPVDDDEEAIRLMNDSRYGLTASIWTATTGTALNVNGGSVNGWNAAAPSSGGRKTRKMISGCS